MIKKMTQEMASVYGRLVQQMAHYERLRHNPYAAYQANVHLTHADRAAKELAQLQGFHDDCLLTPDITRLP